MSSTLFQATLDLARIVGNVVEGMATAGSDTTLIDTNFQYSIDHTSAPIDDYYNYGTIWILTCNNADKTAIITDWVQSTETFTFSAPGAFSAACAAGDLYAVADKTYPRWQLRQCVNKALMSIGGWTRKTRP